MSSGSVWLDNLMMSVLYALHAHSMEPVKKQPRVKFPHYMAWLETVSEPSHIWRRIKNSSFSYFQIRTEKCGE